MLNAKCGSCSSALGPLHFTSHQLDQFMIFLLIIICMQMTHIHIHACARTYTQLFIAFNEKTSSSLSAQNSILDCSNKLIIVLLVNKKTFFFSLEHHAIT